MNILGVSAFYHDSAACLVRDGEIIAAAQEERFTRKKHDADFPRHAVRYCLETAGLASGSELDLVAFYEKPFPKFDRLLSSYLAYAPRGARSFVRAMPLWIKQKLWIKQIVRDELQFKGVILFPEHHESHAASAFFPSPFEEAAVLTVDGVGEWATTTIGHGRGNRVELMAELRFPHSLGLLYSAFTYYLGFRVNSGEYKVMGLAPYGEPRYRDLILRELVDLQPDGSLRLNLKHFDFVAGLKMTAPSFARLFGAPRREAEAEVTPLHMDIARSLQAVTEEAMLRMAQHSARLTGATKLCLAGGVALNCVANGRILREGPFEEIWIQPAAGDAGGALGAALLAWHHYREKPRHTIGGRDAQKGSLLGPEFDPTEYLVRKKIPHRQLPDDQVAPHVAALLAEGKVIGWFQGKMEFGPRALGQRSILADPRLPQMQELLNRKIKFRESFRPFAPAVLRERVCDYFALDCASPYMLLVAAVKSSAHRTRNAEAIDFAARLQSVRSAIPAVTHVDGSARVQTVDAQNNPRFHALLQEFEKRTGCAVLINTSFNVRGEPPVCTPQDAFRCFMATGLDYLVVGNCLLKKEEQTALPPTVARRHNRIIAEYNQLDRTPHALRRFGWIIASAFSAWAALAYLKHHRAAFVFAAALACVIFGLATFVPSWLKQLHRVWMIGSLALGWVMTRLILTFVFFLAVTPIGILQRVCGKRLLEFAFRTGRSSYWEQRNDGQTPPSYENQF